MTAPLHRGAAAGPRKAQPGRSHSGRSAQHYDEYESRARGQGGKYNQSYRSDEYYGGYARGSDTGHTPHHPKDEIYDQPSLRKERMQKRHSNQQRKSLDVFEVQPPEYSSVRSEKGNKEERKPYNADDAY